MHEMGITESILSIVLDTAKKNGAKKVKEVNLQIGNLTNVVSECVEFYFDIISKDTIAEGAKLNIERIPVKVKCSQCGNVFSPKDMVFFCPKCKDMGTEIISGKELAVSSIEID